MANLPALLPADLVAIAERFLDAAPAGEVSLRGGARGGEWYHIHRRNISRRRLETVTAF